MDVRTASEPTVAAGGATVDAAGGATVDVRTAGVGGAAAARMLPAGGGAPGQAQPRDGEGGKTCAHGQERLP